MIIPITIFHIETLPKDLNERLTSALEYKLRNVSGKEREDKELLYRFYEPTFARICTIGVIHGDGEREVREEQFFSMDDERGVIKYFIDYISKFTGRFVSYNGIDFSVPFILYKCIEYGIEPPQRFCNLIRYRTDPHYDLFQILNHWGRFKISLSEACISFEIQDPKEAIGGHDILSFMLNASESDIKYYNIVNIRSIYELYLKTSKIFQ